jgi:hypothetical protein
MDGVDGTSEVQHYIQGELDVDLCLLWVCNTVSQCSHLKLNLSIRTIVTHTKRAILLEYDSAATGYSTKIEASITGLVVSDRDFACLDQHPYHFY